MISRKTQFVLKIATCFYLFCSFFGLFLYGFLPPVLSSVGARLHAYLIIIAAFHDGPASAWMLTEIVLSHVLLLMIVVTGIIAVVKDRFKLYSILVVLENLLTLSLLLCQDAGVYDFTAGVFVNLAYCIWLIWIVYFRKPVDNATTSH